MLNLDAYRANIAASAHRDIATLRREFERLTEVAVALPAGEAAYRTLPRTSGEWRMQREGPRQC